LNNTSVLSVYFDKVELTQMLRTELKMKRDEVRALCKNKNAEDGRMVLVDKLTESCADTLDASALLAQVTAKDRVSFNERSGGSGE
jgi:hypothetical protein